MISLLQRHKLIIKYLINRGDWVNSLELARELNVSDRTIRGDINLINKILIDYNLKIKSARGKGYRIDEDKANLFNKLLLAEGKNIPVLPEERMKFVIEELLMKKEGVDIFSLADEIFVSEQTIEADIKKIKNILQNKNIDLLIAKEGDIFKIEGDELYKRYLLCSVVMDGTFESLLDLYNYSPYLRDVDLIKIKDIILKNIKGSNFAFSDLDLVSLIVHCAVSVHRVKQNFYLGNIDDFNEEDISQEVEIARNIAEDLNKEYNVRFNDLEIKNLAKNISFKRVSLHHEQFKLGGDDIDEKSMNIVEALLKEVKNEFKLDLTNDKQLKVYLAFHMESLMERIQYNKVSRNPYLDDIKNRYPFLFELSVFIRKKFYELTNMSLDEDEIGYIAIHLGAAVERLKIGNLHKKVALLSHTSFAQTQLIYNKLQNLFSYQVEIIGSFASYEIENLQEKKPDMIISTLRIPEEIQIPSVVISPFLNDRDIVEIRNFLMELDIEEERKKLTNQVKEYVDEDLFYTGLNFENPYDAMNFMADKMIDKGYAPEEFKDLVFKREKISPTSFDNYIAMPHAIESNGYKTGISVLILEKPIKWEQKTVQIIFMFSLKKGEQKQLKDIYKLIQNLILGDRENIKKLIKIKDPEDFIQELINNFTKEGEESI